jgi:hypothetical protein
MKSTSEKSAEITTTTATQATQEPFFGKQGGGGFFEGAKKGRKPSPDIIKLYKKNVNHILYKGSPVRFISPSAKNAIKAYEYMKNWLNQDELSAFKQTYPQTYETVMENLPAEFLDRDSSGFQIGVLNLGSEREKLLERLEDTNTWNNPGLLKLVLSQVFQTFERDTGMTGNTQMPTSKEMLNVFLGEKYTSNRGNQEIKIVLDEMHITDKGYAPSDMTGKYAEYSLAKMAMGASKTLGHAEKNEGVVLSYFGINQKSELKGFALDEFQEYTGGALGGVRFGDGGKEKKSAKLDFSADLKEGDAIISSTNLPFQSINYLSDEFTFKTDGGHFKAVKAHFDWPAKSEDSESIGKIDVSIGDLEMNNLRIIFSDETYGLSSLSLKGLNATIYQAFGTRKDMDTLSELQDKFIDIFYDISQFVTYAIQLSLNRFSPDLAENSGKEMEKVITRAMYENLALQIHFDSLDIDNLLIIDNDYPEGKTKYPVDASQEYMKKIYLGKSDLSIKSKNADPEIAVYENIRAIKENAATENRQISENEKQQIENEQSKVKKAHEDRREVNNMKRELNRLIVKNEEKGSKSRRENKIKELEEKISKLQKNQKFHLKFNTSGAKFDDPEMINKIVKDSASSLVDDANINTLPEPQGAASIDSAIFETDFTADGLTNTTLHVSNLVIPDVTASAIHYISDDYVTQVTGGATQLANINADFTIYFKDPDPDKPDNLIDHIDIKCAWIGKAAVDGLRFISKKQAKDTSLPDTIQVLTVPKGQTAIIENIALEGWKVAWNEENKMHGSMMDGVKKSDLDIGNILLPKNTSYSSKTEGESASMIGNAITDVSFKNITFATVRNPDSKAADQVEYSFSFDDAQGIVQVSGDKGEARFDLVGMQLSKGLYYKESDDADVVQFELNKIDIPGFRYESETLKIESETSTVFNDIGLHAHLRYCLNSNGEREDIESLMLNELIIKNIQSNTLSVFRRSSPDKEWEKLIDLSGAGLSELNNISVKELGYDFDNKKIVLNSSTLVNAGMPEGADPALSIPFFSTYFGKNFAADYKNLRVRKIELRGTESGMASVKLTGIALDDLSLKKLKISAEGEGLGIESTGNNAHLKTISADVSIEFDPNGDSKEQIITIDRLTAKRLDLYGLKITKGTDIITELKPELKSTIDNISIGNFKIKTDTSGKKSVDYSQTVASTGKIDAADLSVKIGSMFSSESGLEAAGLSFKGTGEKGFELTIAQPEITDTGDKEKMKGSADGGITFGAFGDGPVISGSALVIRQSEMGNMSYILKNPVIKGLKVDLEEKGMHFEIDAKINEGELVASEGKSDFTTAEVLEDKEPVLSDAWVLETSDKLEITRVYAKTNLLATDNRSKDEKRLDQTNVWELINKENEVKRAFQEKYGTTYYYLNPPILNLYGLLREEEANVTHKTIFDMLFAANGNITIHLFDHPINLPVEDGQVNINGLNESAGTGFSEFIAMKDESVFGASMVALANDIHNFLEHGWLGFARFGQFSVEDWQEDLIEAIAEDRGIPFLSELTDRFFRNHIHIDANGTIVRIVGSGFNSDGSVNLEEEMFSHALVERRYYDPINGIPLSRLLDYQTRNAKSETEEPISSTEEYEEISNELETQALAYEDLVEQMKSAWEDNEFELLGELISTWLTEFIRKLIEQHTQFEISLDGIAYTKESIDALNEILAGEEMGQVGQKGYDPTASMMGSLKINKSTPEKIDIGQSIIPGFTYLNESKKMKVVMGTIGLKKATIDRSKEGSEITAGAIINGLRIDFKK